MDPFTVPAISLDTPALLLSAAAAVTIGIGWRCAKFPPFPGRAWFVRMQMSAAWWALAAALENLAGARDAKVFWAEMAWAGIILCPTAWALFIWSYVNGEERPLPGLLRHLPAVMTVVTLAVALTNQFHGLMYAHTGQAGAGEPVAYVHGPWFFVTTIYLYAFMLLSVVGIAHAIQRSHGLYRRHYLGFALAMLLPWIANVGYVTGTLLLWGFDPTPFSFLLMGSIFFWLISRRQLFDLLPIALTTLVDAMPDPLIVLDAGGTIVEANRAAEALMGKALAGTRLDAMPALQRPLAALLGQATDILHDVVLGEQRFEVRRVAVDHQGRLVGMLLLFRDATKRLQAEARLQATLDELEAQLDTNLRLQEQLREQATRDSLTGLYNRHFFDEVRPLVLEEAQVMRQPLTAVMIDLDHFKKLNDTWGHAAGDAVLKGIGEFLTRSVRSRDYVFRMGGEELLLLLPDTGPAEALACLERWRGEFRRQPLASPGGGVPVTFSAGVAAFPEDAQDWDGLLRRADEALYRAKQDGRDCARRWGKGALACPL